MVNLTLFEKLAAEERGQDVFKNSAYRVRGNHRSCPHSFQFDELVVCTHVAHHSYQPVTASVRAVRTGVEQFVSTLDLVREGFRRG